MISLTSKKHCDVTETSNVEIIKIHRVVRLLILTLKGNFTIRVITKERYHRFFYNYHKMFNLIKIDIVTLVLKK